MKIFLLTDLHFNHPNIIIYENRPENYKDIIIKNCQTMIGKDDTVYNLGDVIFKQKGELKSIMGMIPGTHHLCMGNHDNEKPDWYLKQGFATVQKTLLYDDIIFSHHPIDIDAMSKTLNIAIKFNIHGHFHNKQREEKSRTIAGYPFYSDKHICLSIEAMDYKPIELYDFLKLKGKI